MLIGVTLPADYKRLSSAMRRQVRLEYVRRQGGMCRHCKAPLSGKPTQEMQDKFVRTNLFPKNFFDWPVHLHHSHKTGLTVGAVHAKCNAVLWQYHGE